MINEEVFKGMLKIYNKEINEQRKSEGLMNLGELKLRQALTDGIMKENQNKEFDLDMKSIINIIKNEDYNELHKKLQKTFNQFIPFVTIRRFLNKTDIYGVEKVCSMTNKYKNKSYSDAMGLIR